MVFSSESMVDWEQELAAAGTKGENWVTHCEAGERPELKALQFILTT